MTQHSQERRRGSAFSIRLTPEEREALNDVRAGVGPAGLGPWLVWNALNGPRARALPAPAPKRATRSRRTPLRERIILDLCGGSGAWSMPYRDAGYDVRVISWPDHDVRTFVPPSNVWGVLCAPPCNEFSQASPRKFHERDMVAGMSCVNACMRIVLQCRPKWWALENPARGHLAKFLRRARDTFEPHDFGDPWTKVTSIWGSFTLPKRGPHVKPTGSAMSRKTPAERAITPSGFARAFFEANP